jgi:hypothetical protein
MERRDEKSTTALELVNFVFGLYKEEKLIEYYTD